MPHAWKFLVPGLLLFCTAAAAQTPPPGAPLPPISTPLPDPDMPALIRAWNIAESARPVREFLPNWHRPRKILVYPDNNTNRMAWLRAVVPADVQLVEIKSPGQGLKELPDADGEIGAGCTKDMINASGANFELVQMNVTGVERCFEGGDVPAKLKPGGTVVVANQQKVAAPAVGYHAFALMVALSRGLEVYARRDDKGNFPPFDHNQFWELKDRTLLIVGLGSIGSILAKQAHDLGMHVIAINRSMPNPVPDYVEHVGLSPELDGLLPKADVVASGLPLTNETSGLFNAAFFAKMKRGAMFINVTRAEEVVEADLAAAVKSGQVGSVALDDYDRSGNSPLLRLPTVLLTPHTGAQEGMAPVETEDTWALSRENLRRFIAGDKLLSVVDPAKGY